MRRLAPLAAIVIAAFTFGARADEFEEAPSGRSLAFGPVPVGETNLSLDVGWLRSGLRADIGAGFDFDLVIRLDSFLLQDGFGGQTGGYAGIRVSPLEDGLFRVALSFEVGEVIIPQRVGSIDSFVLRGDVAAGISLDPYGVAYARVALRGQRAGGYGYTSWGRDEEAGVGYEVRVANKVLLGAEAYTWARPKLPALPEWRLRVGYAF
ncbi:MAG TPA: hypothetical protein VF904_09255 [Anaeromyxobacteraceae bacterium]